MTTKAALFAKELLELEAIYQKGQPFDDKQSQRWHELVAKVFGPENAAHGRRSFRLPSELPCTVKIGHGSFDCKVLEVSRIGVSLIGVVLRHITHDHEVELVSVQRGKRAVALGLACNVARLEPTKEPPLAGLLFATTVPTSARQRFFDEIYYPSYLTFLENLAKGA